MLGVNKNIRDTSKDPIKDTSFISIANGLSPKEHMSSNIISYTKIDKLITALYMVTDIMEKDEPMRLKLRTLGTEILSDISIYSLNLNKGHDEKISTILSFLNIASDLRMISEMNHNILRKEFVELKQSVQRVNMQNNLWLEEFMPQSTSPKDVFDKEKEETDFSIGHFKFNKGHNISTKQTGTRIGVQKGSTLLKALSNLQDSKILSSAKEFDTFEVLKNKRREEIISIIKNKKSNTGIEGATITDIKNEAKGLLVSCGEKTLQRELISMVKDNVLKKTGEKRWSHYSLVSSN